MMKRLFSRAGMSLIEVVVAIGVASIGLTAVLKIAEVIKQSGRSSEIRQDLQQVVSTIRSNLSCQQTFISYGTTRPIPCNGSVVLKNKAGLPLLNNSKLADWTIEAKCEVLGGNNGLSMYASKLKANGTTSIDPLTGKAYDQSNSLSMLFKADVRPCQDYFGNSIITFKNCGPNEYLKGIDFDTRELNCVPGGVQTLCSAGQVVTGLNLNTNSAICATISDLVPSCGSGEVLRKVGGILQCAKVGLDMTDCMIIQNGGGPPNYVSQASCPAGFKLVSGYGSCTHNIPGKSYVHTIGSDGTSFHVDCFTQFNSESSTLVGALCCRYNL